MSADSKWASEKRQFPILRQLSRQGKRHSVAPRLWTPSVTDLPQVEDFVREIYELNMWSLRDRDSLAEAIITVLLLGNPIFLHILQRNEPIPTFP